MSSNWAHGVMLNSIFNAAEHHPLCLCVCHYVHARGLLSARFKYLTTVCLCQHLVL